MTMIYRRLGRSGLKVSALSLGSWVTYGNQLDTKVARECMAAAYDAGVNFFDNAEVYAKGESERIMGAALKALGWRRSSYIVSTKFFWGLHDGPNEKNTLNRKYLTEAIDGSLARLALDHVDLVFCHRPDPDTPIEETVCAMHDIIAAGKALYWGTSEWSAAEIMAAWQVAERHHLHKPVTEQPQYNLFHRERVEREYARLYEDIGLGTTIWSPLASGVLTGKYNDGVPPDSRAALKGYEWLAERILDAGQAAAGARAGADRARPRLHAGAACARVVREESERVDGDHRREPARAGRGEHEGAGRAAEAHRRRARAHRRHRRRRRVSGKAAMDRPVAMVTAASKGMGAACARELASRGYRVSLMARGPEVEDAGARAWRRGDSRQRRRRRGSRALRRRYARRLRPHRRGRQQHRPPAQGPAARELADADWHAGLDLAARSTSCAWRGSSRRRCASNARRDRQHFDVRRLRAGRPLPDLVLPARGARLVLQALRGSGSSSRASG